MDTARIIKINNETTQNMIQCIMNYQNICQIMLSHDMQIEERLMILEGLQQSLQEVKELDIRNKQFYKELGERYEGS